MAENSVTTTFFSDEKAAVAAIAKLEKKYDELENKIRHVHKHHNEGSHEALEHVTELAKGIGGMVLGFASAEAGIEKMFDAMKEFRQEADAAALSVEKANRQFMIRAGIYGPQGKEAIEKVEKGATAAGLPDAEAKVAYGDFARHGYSDKALLENFEDVARAIKLNQEATGVDTATLASAVEYSADKHAEKSADALKKGLRDVFAMTNRTNVAPGDLPAISETFETLGKSKSGDGQPNPKVASALFKLKMKVQDFDRIDEDLPTIVKNLKAHLEANVAETERMSTLANLTGNARVTENLVQMMGQMRANEANFPAAQATATQGGPAALQQAQNIKERRLAQVSEDWELYKTTAENLAAAYGKTMGTPIASTAASFFHSLGVSNETAIEQSFGHIAGKNPAQEFGAQVKELVELQKKGIDVQERLLLAVEKNRGKPQRTKGQEE